jgi:NTP pyrophosphatase (non-canonical NTP hydrolase)
MAYHKVDIPKGIYGELNKIEEEFLELKDATQQKNKILIACELADLYGAIEAYAKGLGISMTNVINFCSVKLI